MIKKLDQFVTEVIKLDIKVGDTVLGGRFKNKKTVVKKIGKNKKGDITINGKPLLKFRIIKEHQLSQTDNSFKSEYDYGIDYEIKISEDWERPIVEFIYDDTTIVSMPINLEDPETIYITFYVGDEDEAWWARSFPPKGAPMKDWIEAIDDEVKFMDAVKVLFLSLPGHLENDEAAEGLTYTVKVDDLPREARKIKSRLEDIVRNDMRERVD